MTQTNPLIMETSSGMVFRADRVIAVNGARGEAGRRIVMEGGEVLTDHWPTEAEAADFATRVKFAMRGIEAEICATE